MGGFRIRSRRPRGLAVAQAADHSRTELRCGVDQSSSGWIRPGSASRPSRAAFLPAHDDTGRQPRASRYRRACRRSRARLRRGSTGPAAHAGPRRQPRRQGALNRDRAAPRSRCSTDAQRPRDSCTRPASATHRRRACATMPRSGVDARWSNRSSTTSPPAYGMGRRRHLPRRRADDFRARGRRPRLRSWCRIRYAVDDHQTGNARYLVDAGRGRADAAVRTDAESAGGGNSPLLCRADPPDCSSSAPMRARAPGQAGRDARAWPTCVSPRGMGRMPHEGPDAQDQPHSTSSASAASAWAVSPKCTAEPRLYRAGIRPEGFARDEAACAASAPRSSSVIARDNVGDADLVVVSSAIDPAESGDRRRRATSVCRSCGAPKCSPS